MERDSEKQKVNIQRCIEKTRYYRVIPFIRYRSDPCEARGRNQGFYFSTPAARAPQRPCSQATHAPVGEISWRVQQHAFNAFNRDLTKLQRQRQQEHERLKHNRFRKQSNNSARASRFFVSIFAVLHNYDVEITQ